ncbi:hypothetical protein V5799_007534 [Amblyomma americanum]|uniref:E3 ubiquitin-protein ligase n=1 Tax=Amblyomma americanum TaxID=6943 RepID=A0AAQ4FFT0_AMBAM
MVVEQVPDLEVDLVDPEWTIFRAVQHLVQASEMGSKQDKIRRIWEPMYIIVYKAAKEDSSPPKDELPRPTPVARPASSGKSGSREGPLSAYCSPGTGSALEDGGCTVDDVLQLLRLLSTHRSRASHGSIGEGSGLSIGCIEDILSTVTMEDFLSKKITNKLVQQIQVRSHGDPLVLSSGSQPDWCEHLTYNCPMLFPFETRQLYFSCTAFGASRSIVWLQNQRDASAERHRGPSPRREDPHEFRVGRLKHERVKVPRGDKLLDWAMQVMRLHAPRKTVLEVEFQNEEGTGLGPTLEFYALVAEELQRRDLGMWLCEDIPTTNDKKPIAASSGTADDEGGLGGESCSNRPPGYYIHTAYGLFPAPLPQGALCSRVCASFHFLGIFLAKALQDGRLVDLPLSRPFLRLLCQGPSPALLVHQQQQPQSHHTGAGHGAVAGSTAASGRQTATARLTFQFCPSSKVYGFDAVELKPGGEQDEVTLDNIEEYTELLADFCLHTGIRRQMEAFRVGFCKVFPMEKLGAFSPEEVRLMLCGEQNPVWSREDVLNYTEPKLGYTRDSPGFQRFVNVLVDMTGAERKAFLQFTTGCSSLPPGGLANLHPRLTVVRKVDASDGSFPSVNTCAHYLKLPDYSSEALLRERLLAATREKGFHLN